MDKIWQGKCPSFKPLDLSCGHNPGSNNWNIQAPSSAFPEGLGNTQVWEVVEGTCHRWVLSLDSVSMRTAITAGELSLKSPFQFCPQNLWYLGQGSIIINMKKSRKQWFTKASHCLEPLIWSSVTSNRPERAGHAATSPAMGAIPLSAELLLPNTGSRCPTARPARTARHAQERQRWH